MDELTQRTWERLGQMLQDMERELSEGVRALQRTMSVLEATLDRLERTAGGRSR